MDLSVQYIIITNPVKYQIAKNLILTQNDQHAFRIPFPIQKKRILLVVSRLYIKVACFGF